MDSLDIMGSAQRSTRDSIFYFQDGDVILQVAGILFKVHRAKLSGTFITAFDMVFHEASTSSAKRGDSDECPLELEPQVLDEFRALLSCLYSANPEDIVHPPVSFEHELYLINLGLASQRWGFAELEAACLHLILDFRSLIAPNIANLSRLTTLSSRYANPDTEIYKLVHRTWAHFLKQGQYCSVALHIGESCSDIELVSQAYFSLALKGPVEWFSEVTLTDTHRERLALGFRRLTELEDNLCDHPPPLEHHKSCTHTREECVSGWADLWHDTVQQVEETLVSSGDIVSKLLAVQAELPDLSLLAEDPKNMTSTIQALKMHPPCIESGWQAAIDAIGVVTSTPALINYFLHD